MTHSTAAGRAGARRVLRRGPGRAGRPPERNTGPRRQPGRSGPARIPASGSESSCRRCTPVPVAGRASLAVLHESLEGGSSPSGGCAGRPVAPGSERPHFPLGPRGSTVSGRHVYGCAVGAGNLRFDAAILASFRIRCASSHSRFRSNAVRLAPPVRSNWVRSGHIGNNLVQGHG